MYTFLSFLWRFQIYSIIIIISTAAAALAAASKWITIITYLILYLLLPADQVVQYRTVLVYVARKIKTIINFILTNRQTHSQTFMETVRIGLFGRFQIPPVLACTKVEGCCIIVPTYIEACCASPSTSIPTSGCCREAVDGSRRESRGMVSKCL